MQVPQSSPMLEESVESILTKTRGYVLLTISIISLFSSTAFPIIRQLLGLSANYLFFGFIFIYSVITIIFVAKKLWLNYVYYLFIAYINVTLFWQFFLNTSTEKGAMAFITGIPLVSSFLLGKIRGLIWSFGSFTIFLLLWYFNPDNFQINRDELSKIFLAYGGFTLIIYFFNHAIEKYDALVKKRDFKLHETLNQLGTEVQSRKQAQNELLQTVQKLNDQKLEIEKVNTELKKTNGFMVGRELAMVDLKKKLAAFEKKP
jgi:hypothetical protein